MIICPNKRSKSWKNLVAARGETVAYNLWYLYNGEVPESEYGVVEEITPTISYKPILNQIPSTEGKIVSKKTKKTIRDLAARISDRIGMPIKFESDRSKEYKGKIENNVAYINLAYATLDTPIHEILGHPIIRAIKNNKTILLSFNDWYGNKYGQDKSNWDERLQEYENYENSQKSSNQLYQNLLKELEYGRGKEILDRVKRDYVNKNHQNIYKLKNDDYNDLAVKPDYLRKTFNSEQEAYNYVIKNRPADQYNVFAKLVDQIPQKYTLEEQQEEAIVELLGLMTADKLDSVKDGKLISLLKRLLKEMKQFIRSLINQKEVEIDKLPDNMTLGDLSDLLAYSNSKLILPGYEVEYTTPDNMKFKTYQEASNHISELAKSVKDVDLSSININLEQNKNRYAVYKWNFGKPELIEKGLTKEEAIIKQQKLGKDYIVDFAKDISGELNLIKDFVEKNKEYEQSKDIIEEWKKVNNIQYNPEEIYSRGQEFSSVVGAYSDFDVNLMMQNLLSHIEDNEKAGGKFAISAYTKPVDKKIGHLEGGGGKIKFNIYPKSEDILWASNIDVYSGSVWDAGAKVNKDKKSELLGVSYTKYPSLQNVNTVQPNLASIVDNLAHHHNKLGITLNGNNFRLEYDDNIPYTTKKIIDNINKILDQRYGKLVKPEIKKQIKDLTYTALGEYNQEKRNSVVKEFKTKEEAVKWIEQNKEQYEATTGSELVLGEFWNEGIQPTQTNETLKESIDSVKSKYSTDTRLTEDAVTNIRTVPLEFTSETIGGSYSIIRFENNAWKAIREEGDTRELSEAQVLKAYNKSLGKTYTKNFTEQALINTKIAALKEVAKKYPRSLIRSEVKPINVYDTSSYSLFENSEDELPFQKNPTISYKPKPTNTISIVKQAQFRDSLKAGNKATFTYWSETTSKLVTEKDITITKVDYDKFEGVYENGEERTFKYGNVIDDTISGNLNHKEQLIFKDNLKIGKVFENLKTDLGLINGEVTEIGTDSFKIGDKEIKYAEVYKEESQIRLLERIQALKNSLSNQIVIFQASMRTAFHKKRVDSLRKALEILENYDELVDLEEFFSEVSKNILTSKAYLIAIAQKDLPTEKKLTLISYTKQFLDSFRYVEGLNNAIQNFEGSEKLKAVSKQLVADISDAKQEYFVVAQPAMAKILYEQFNPRTNEQLAELGLDVITEEDILAELNQPSKDLDLFNKFGVAPVNSNDTLLGLFQKMIKNVKESARKMDEYFLRSLNPVIAKLQKKYDIKKVMENFFTIEEVEVFRNGEPQIIRVRKFIKQYNVDKFNDDMSILYQERDSAYRDLALAEEMGDAVARDVARGTILKVTQQIDAYRQTNGKIIDAKTSKYLTEKYIAKDPIKFNNLLDRYYMPVEFEQTNQDSITYTDEETGETTYYNYKNNRWGANRDNYITTKYSELQKYLDSDPDIKAFYNIIIENYKRANRSIPTAYRLNGILPSIYETNMLKDTKSYFNNFFEENIPQYMARIDGKAHKEIPVGFTKLMDVSESNDDTLKSLMMFFAEANNYSTMNNFLGATENMVELLSVTNPLDENQKQRVTSDVNNRLSAVIKSVDQSVFNKQRDSNGPLSKFVDLLNKFTSLTRMALKPLNWAVNMLRGNMENLFEGIGGRHYTVKDLVWANKEFIKLQSSNPKKLANMIRSLDAIQGRFLKTYGDEFVSFKEKYLKTDILFLGQDLGEIQIQGTSMLAMLNAWGVEIPEDGNFDLDSLPKDFINTLHAVNKRNHGVYNNFDRLYAQDNAFFRLFMQFRKYIAPTYRARFSGIFSGEYRIDQESGTLERGYYREFGEYVYKCMKNLNDLPAMLASFKSMPAVQKEGVRRTVAELITFFTLYTLVNLVKGDDEEEEDEMSPVEWYTVYFAARLRGELGAYLPVFGTKDQLRIISNPFAAAPVVGDVFNLFATITDFDPDKDGNISIFKEYQRKTGVHEKGDLKVLGKFSKLNPLDNVLETFYPEEMYDNFEAASKR